MYPGDVLRYAITISNTGGAVATLFAGQRWGWISLVAALATSLAMRGGVPADPAIRAGAVLYALSGAVTEAQAVTM